DRRHVPAIHGRWQEREPGARVLPSNPRYGSRRGEGDMWKRLVVLVVVLAFLGGGVAIVSLTGSHDTTTSLRKLPVGSAGGAAEGKSTSAVAAAPAMAGDMAKPIDMGVDYTVSGELPALDGKAAAYELSGPGGIDDVRVL